MNLSVGNPVTVNMFLDLSSVIIQQELEYKQNPRMVTPDGMFMSWHRIHNGLLIIAVHKHTADRTGSVSVSQIYFTQTQNKDNKSLDISGKSS